MPPNSTVEPYSPASLSLTDHFWTCDKQGMDRLVSKIKHAYDTLDDILTLYGQRAVLEREFGQNLMKLNKPTEDEITTSHKAIATVYQELAKSAQSHIDMANRLEEQVAGPLKEWIIDHRDELLKIVNGLEKVYNERQDKIFQLLQIREKSQMQSGRRSSIEYESAGEAAEEAVRQWNGAWKMACQQIQVLEQERMDMFTTNIWEYANLASARLMVQDEWCEKIRIQLEGCTVEEELAYYVEKHSTGTSVPTTQEYVEYFAREFKEKMMNKKLPPRPRATSSTTTTLARPNEVSGKSSSVMVKRKPLASNDSGLDALLKKFELSTANRTPKRGESPPRRSADAKPPTELPKRPVSELPLARPSTDRPVELPPARPPMALPKRPVSEIPPSRPPMDLPRRPIDVSERPPSTADLPKRSKPAELPPKPATASESDQPQPVVPKDMIQQQPQPPKSPRPQAAQPPKSPRPQSQHLPPSRPPPMKVSTSQLPSNMPPRSPVMTPHSAAPLSQATPHSPAMPVHSPIMPPPSSLASHSPAITHQQPMMMAPHSPAMAPRSPAMAATMPPHSPAMMAHSPMMPHSPLISHSPNMGPAPHSYYQPPPSPIPPSPWSPATSPYYYRQANSVMQAAPYTDDHQQMHLPDGTPIIFWVRAKYDYSAQDETEVSFNRTNLLAVTGLSQDDKWWNAILWDETWHRPLGSGCIPENYVERLP